MIDLHLAGTFSVRGQTALTLEAAARCEEVARRFSLSSLSMSLALQAVAHGVSGDRRAMMDAIVATARERGRSRHRSNDRAGEWCCSSATLATGSFPRRSMPWTTRWRLLRSTSGGAHDFPGRWALMRTVADDGGGEEAREECRALEFDTPMSRATLRAADAVAAGREGGTAVSLFAAADEELGRLRRAASFGAWPGSSSHPAPTDDGWGAPSCLVGRRSRLRGTAARQLRRPVPAGAPRLWARPSLVAAYSGQAHVPGPLAARGITAREAEVMAHVVAGRSNRDIAERLHLSVRTVEKHLEGLRLKTGSTRSELAELADTFALRPPD